MSSYKELLGYEPLTIKDLHKVPTVSFNGYSKGYLIKVDTETVYGKCGSYKINYRLNTRSSDWWIGEWFIGILIPSKYRDDQWACSILAMKLYEGTNGRPLQLPIGLTDHFYLIEPTDLPKYINYLTDAGTNFLKELNQCP